jgi:hypothetical protein
MQQVKNWKKTAVGRKPLSVGRGPLAVGRLPEPFKANYQLSIINYPLFTIPY